MIIIWTRSRQISRSLSFLRQTWKTWGGIVNKISCAWVANHISFRTRTGLISPINPLKRSKLKSKPCFHWQLSLRWYHHFNWMSLRSKSVVLIHARLNPNHVILARRIWRSKIKIHHLENLQTSLNPIPATKTPPKDLGAHSALKIKTKMQMTNSTRPTTLAAKTARSSFQNSTWKNLSPTSNYNLSRTTYHTSWTRMPRTAK